MPQENNAVSFPLAGANAIIPTGSKDVPDKVDLIYIVIVDSPGQSRGQFGPVKAWQDESKGEGVWRIYVPHSFDLLPMMKQRFDYQVSEGSWASGDTTASIFAGMVKKNDYSWDSLVTAYSKNTLCAQNIIGMIQETFAQASMLWWSAFPAVDSDSTRLLLSLSQVSNKKRIQIEQQTEDFIKASTVFDDCQHLSYNSSARRNAQHQLDHYGQILQQELSIELELVENNKSIADDGTVFLQ